MLQLCFLQFIRKSKIIQNILCDTVRLTHLNLSFNVYDSIYSVIILQIYKEHILSLYFLTDETKTYKSVQCDFLYIAFNFFFSLD